MRPALPTCALGTTIPRTRKIRQIASGAGIAADLNPDLSFVRGHYSVGIPGCSTRIAPDCYIRVNSVGDYTGALTGNSGRSLQSWWGFQFKDAGSFQNGEPVVTRLSHRGTRWPAFPTEAAWICFGPCADTAPAHHSSQTVAHFLRPARHYSPKAKKPQRLTIPLVQRRRALWRRVQMQELSTARVPSCGLRRLVSTNPECDRFARQPPAGTYFRRVSTA